MSIVAFDGRELVGAHAGISHGMHYNVASVRRFGELLAGAVGTILATVACMRWVREGCLLNEWPACQRDHDERADLIMILGGKIVRYESTPYPIPVLTPYFAIGCSSDVAMAWLARGRSARDAVAAANACGCGCGAGITSLSVED